MPISYPILDTFASPLSTAFGLPAAAEGLTWVLQTTGITAPVYTPTYTGPSTFWTPDYNGVFQNVGGLVNARGSAIPPVAGGRILAGPTLSATDASGVALSGMQLVLQPSVTNKVTCRKRNPTDITNLTKGGDAASVLSVVASSAALTTAGLATICSGGNVYKLDNSLGVAVATATAGGTTGNTNKHSLAVWARKVSGSGSSLLQMSGAEASTAITGTAFSRFVVDNITPGATTRQWQLVAGIGDVIEFILPNMTETMAATAYPVVDVTDTTASVTFSATDLAYSNPMPKNDWQFRCKVKMDGTPTTDMWLWTDGTIGCYYRGSDSKLVYRSETYGADVLGGAGSFTSAVGWTLGGNWQITGGVLTNAGAAGANEDAFYSITTTSGKMYKITYTVNSISGGVVSILTGNVGTTNTTTGTKTDYTRSTVDGVTNFRIRIATAGHAATIDNLTVVEVKEVVTAAVTVGNTYDFGVRQSSVAGASVSLNQSVTTDATVTSDHTAVLTLSIGEKGDNTLYFRGRLQQFANTDFLAFSFNDGTNWFSEDI